MATSAQLGPADPARTLPAAEAAFHRIGSRNLVRAPRVGRIPRRLKPRKYEATWRGHLIASGGHSRRVLERAAHRNRSSGAAFWSSLRGVPEDAVELGAAHCTGHRSSLKRLQYRGDDGGLLLVVDLGVAPQQAEGGVGREAVDQHQGSLDLLDRRAGMKQRLER